MSTKNNLYDLNIEMKLASQPLKYKGVLNAYEKGSFFCVLHLIEEELIVDKIPMENIHRIRERYHYQERDSRILSNVRATLKSPHSSLCWKLEPLPNNAMTRFFMSLMNRIQVLSQEKMKWSRPSDQILYYVSGLVGGDPVAAQKFIDLTGGLHLWSEKWDKRREPMFSGCLPAVSKLVFSERTLTSFMSDPERDHYCSLLSNLHTVHFNWGFQYVTHFPLMPSLILEFLQRVPSVHTLNVSSGFCVPKGLGVQIPTIKKIVFKTSNTQRYSHKAQIEDLVWDLQGLEEVFPLTGRQKNRRTLSPHSNR